MIVSRENDSLEGMLYTKATASLTMFGISRSRRGTINKSDCLMASPVYEEDVFKGINKQEKQKED